MNEALPSPAPEAWSSQLSCATASHPQQPSGPSPHLCVLLPWHTAHMPAWGSPEALKQAHHDLEKAHLCPAAVGNEGLAPLQALKAHL